MAAAAEQIDLTPEEAALRTRVEAEELAQEFADWLQPWTYRRYTNARPGAPDDAFALLMATLRWRKEYGVAVQTMLPGGFRTLSLENSTCKMYVRGRDKLGRAIVYMRPRGENTFDHDGNILHLVYCLERATRETQSADGKLTIIIDYDGYSLRNAPPMKTSRQTLTVVQDYFPERLGAAFMIAPPWIFSAFWKVISPFIAPVTKSKIHFVRNPTSADGQRELAEVFDLDELEEAVGGRNSAPMTSADFLAADPVFEGRMDVAAVRQLDPATPEGAEGWEAAAAQAMGVAGQ